jgi:DNA-binding SARP family transcriptional activator/tetratricopeptide (TPR) repeat protein
MTLRVEPKKTTSALELRLFGTGEVWLEGRRLAVGHRKTLALLAFLALEGETSRSQLAGVFWSEYDEESARRNLRRELHRLRESGLRDQVQTTGENLRLLGLQTTDVAQFLLLIEAGHLEAALEVYTNEFLKGLRLEKTPEFDAWLDEKRTALSTVHRRAQLELAERLETKGDWFGALELHKKVLKEDVLQERQHREVMRFEYLLGNREAALAQFEECRRLLKEELGLEPLPTTVQLAQQIRAAQKLEPSAPVQLSGAKALRIPLVGREKALSELSSSHVPLTLILGDAGVGKSFLLEQFAPRGLRISFRQVSSQTPLYVIAETLRDLLSDLEARDRFDQLDAVWQQEAARLVPELSPNSNQQAQERILFLEGLARALECLNLENAAVVLEDLHWADSASLELIAHLVRRAVREPKQMRLLATARASELGVEAQGILAALEKDGLTTTIRLETLSELEVQELIRAMSGADMPVFARRLFAVTAGNPFFLLETVRYLFEQGELEMQGETWRSKNNLETIALPLPPSVRETVLNRVDDLGSATRRLLETAALTDNSFLLEEIQPATALNEWESLEGLERAVNAQLLRRLEVGFGFVHDLARQALQSVLGLERQRLIHRKLAVSLEQASADPARIAGHLEQAGKAVAAVLWRVKAAENASRVYAHPQALEQYQKALENGATSKIAFEILQARLNIWESLGQTMPWQADLEQLALRTSQNDLTTTSQLQFARVRFALHQRDFDEALRLATTVIETSKSNEITAQAYAFAGTALVQQSQLEAAKNHLTQALDLLPDQHVLRAKVLNQLFQVEFDVGNIEQADEHLSSALRSSQITQNLLDELATMNNQGKIALGKGDNDLAARIYEIALQKVKPINNPTLERSIVMGLAGAYSRLHRLDESLQLLERALELAELTNAVAAQGGIYHTTGAVYRRKTQFGFAVEHYTVALEIADQIQQHPARIFRRLSLADLYLDLGNSQKALPLIEQTHAIIEQTGVRTEADWCQILLGKQQRLAGQISASLKALEMPEPDNPFDRVIWLTELALTRLAAQDFTGVLALLEGEDAPPNTMSQLLGIRLQALAALKKPFAQELSQITALESELTPLFLLHFHVALTRTHRFAQETKLAEHHQTLARENWLDMAATLGEYPDLKNPFLELYTDLF